MEYAEPLNQNPVGGMAFAGRDEVNQMRNMLEILGNPADMNDMGGNIPPLPKQRINQPVKQPRQPQMPNNFDLTNRTQMYNNIPAMGEVPLYEETNYDMAYQQPMYDPQPQQFIQEDISFIKNKEAKNSVEKYLNRGMNLYSTRIQEIIALDEELTSLKKDAADLKARHTRCKELNLTEAKEVFSSQFKQTGAKIKITEIKLKNINSSINEF